MNRPRMLAAGIVSALFAAVSAILLLTLCVSAAPLLSDADSDITSAQVEPSIVYAPDTNTIEVKRPGSVVTLSTIDKALNNEALLERLGPSEWLLKANISAFEQVRLEFHGTAAGGDVNWLKLLSEPDRFVTIESSNGQISISNTRITSWDNRANTFDTQFLDGSKRAFIAIKNRSERFTDNRMDVIDSEIAYLGFFEETAYGISWKVISEPGKGDTGILGRGLTGIITGSKFHHNYFGVYVLGVGDMAVRNNEIYENYYYGFDAHTMTQRTVVEGNSSHDNGGHGIIFAERCAENIVRRNSVVDNKGHGIMLHELSDRNTIEDNTVSGNDDGIPIFESSDNVISRNVVRNNVTGVRVYGRDNPSRGNLFQGNEISGSKSYGVFVYDAAIENTFRDNRVLSSAGTGIYGKSIMNNLITANLIRGNEDGIRLDSPEVNLPSRGNQVRDNVISNNRQYGLFSYSTPDANVVEDNRFSGNRRGDIGYAGQPVSGAGGIGVTGVLRILVFAAIVIVGVVSALFAYSRRRG